MKYFTFETFGNESLEIEFDCNVCGTRVYSENIDIPYPNYMAESSRDSQTDNDGEAVCEGCGKEFQIEIYSTFSGGDGRIDELDDEDEIHITENPEPYFEEQFEAISSNTLFLQTFQNEIGSLKELNQTNINNASSDKTLRRQIFVGTITALETYLSDAFINTTLNNPKFVKKFVETFHDFKEHPIQLKELFDYHDKINEICKQAMLDVLYHNLPKVKGMYKDTLGIDLGDISIPYKGVLIRHDLVHRNGKTKAGTPVIIDKAINDDLISAIEDFVEKIDAQIETLSFD